MLRARGARRSQSRPFAAKANASLILAGERTRKRLPRTLVMCGGVGTLAPTLRAARYKFFRLNNLDSQSNYGIDVMVLFDGKEILKNENVF